MQNFESGSSSNFEDMTSQNFPQKKGTSHQIRLFTRGGRLNLKNTNFYVQNRSTRPKIDLHINFSNFQVEENFFIPKFWGRLDEKRAAATP